MVSQPFTSSLGTDDELSALIQEAQSRGINIGPALSLSTSKDELLTNLKARLAAESRPEVQALRAEATARTAGNPFLSALFGQGERPTPEQAFYGAPGTGLGANPLFQTYINPSVTENLPEPVQMAIGQVANPIGTISAIASPLRTAGAVGGSVLAQQVARKAGAGPVVQNVAGLAGGIVGGAPELLKPPLSLAGQGAAKAGAVLEKTGLPSPVSTAEAAWIGKAVPPAPVVTPAQKFVDFLNSQNPRTLERQTNLARRAVLSTKAAGVSEALGGNLPTEAAFRAARAAQRGELPKAMFEPAAKTGQGFIPETVRPDLFDQPDIENLYDTVRNSKLQSFDKQNAADALTRALLGELPAPHEIRYLRSVFGDSFGDALLRHRSFGPKAWDMAVEVANIPRTLFQTVLDFSGLLRQGAVLAAARPLRSLKTAPDFIRPLFSEKYFNTIQESIKTDPVYTRAQTAKLFLAETSSDVTAREEAFISRLAQKIPLWGKIIRGSERSYVGGLNKLRFDSFKDSLHGWANQGLTPSPEMEEQLATVLNYATGRGSLGPANRAAPVLSAVFYSPRFLASRIELPFEDLRNLQRAGQAAIARDPKLAVAYAGLARNTVAFVGAGMTILTLLKLREDGKELNVESDARSPDFGRIRYRHTRFDFWAGYQPITRYTWQVIVQKTKSLPEAKSPGKLNPAQGSDIVARFLRSKLAPAPGLAADILNRRTISGQELSPSAETAGQLAYREFVPFFVTSLNDAAQQYGAQYSLLGLPSAAGVSVDTYNPKPRTVARVGSPYQLVPAR